MYRVHVGYTPTGRDRWRTFETIEAAKLFCSRTFRQCGILLTIIQKQR